MDFVHADLYAADAIVDRVRGAIYWPNAEGRQQVFFQSHQEAQMEFREKHDDSKIIAALVCLFVGLLFVWNISVYVSDYYELRLDAETCSRVKTLGLMPSADCTITAPYRPIGLGPVGYLILPDGNDIQITPVAASRTNKSAEWSTSMKVQLWIALLFWAATLVLLLNAFRNRR